MTVIAIACDWPRPLPVHHHHAHRPHWMHHEALVCHCDEQGGGGGEWSIEPETAAAHLYQGDPVYVFQARPGAVPESGTWLMLMIGAVAMLALGARKRRAKL